MNAIIDQARGISIKGKRYIILPQDNNATFFNLGLPDTWVSTRGQHEKLWINRIIDALIHNGYLFKLYWHNDYGYCMQA